MVRSVQPQKPFAPRIIRLKRMHFQWLWVHLAFKKLSSGGSRAITSWFNALKISKVHWHNLYWKRLCQDVRVKSGVRWTWIHLEHVSPSIFAKRSALKVWTDVFLWWSRRVEFPVQPKEDLVRFPDHSDIHWPQRMQIWRLFIRGCIKEVRS